MPDLTLRSTIRADDRSQLERILRCSGAFREEEVAIGLELIDETLRPRRNTDYLWVIAERGDSILGFACYGPVPMTDGTFDLYWLAVATDSRGSNVATRLDDAVEAEVRKRGGRWVLAETSSTEPYAPARRFYAKRGYSLVERIPDFYRDGDDRITFGKRL